MNAQRQHGDTHSPDLSGLLRDLGQELPPERDEQAEIAREMRFAARMNAQLDGLAQARKRSRAGWGVLLLAAALPLTFLALRQHAAPGSALSIAREPTSRAAKHAPTTDSLVSTGQHEPAAAPTAPPRKVEQRPNLVPAAPGSSAGESPSAAAPEAPGLAKVSSTLAEENRLFRDAVGAAHAGNIDQALGGFEQLLGAYPRSPLAQTALTRKFRLLASAGRKADAQAQAQRYLSLYPTGFAEREAQAVAKGEALPDSGAHEEDPSAP